MTSTDREILIAINDRIERIELRQTEQGQQIAEQAKQIAEMRRENDYRFHRIEDKIDNLQHSVYWIFAAIGIFLAAIAVILRKPEAPKDDSIRLTPSQFGTLIVDRLNDLRKGDAQ